MPEQRVADDEEGDEQPVVPPHHDVRPRSQSFDDGRWNCCWKRACAKDSAWRRMAALSKARDDTSRRPSANASTDAVVARARRLRRPRRFRPRLLPPARRPAGRRPAPRPAPCRNPRRPASGPRGSAGRGRESPRPQPARELDVGPGRPRQPAQPRLFGPLARRSSAAPRPRRRRGSRRPAACTAPALRRRGRTARGSGLGLAGKRLYRQGDTRRSTRDYSIGGFSPQHNENSPHSGPRAPPWRRPSGPAGPGPASAGASAAGPT